jgi:predicted ester cyclase
MSTAILTAKQLVEDYFTALSGHPKTEQLIDTFVTAPALKKHILDTEVSFPNYKLTPIHIVSEGDIVAVNSTFTGTHKGTFAGIEPTGKTVSIPAMIFYRVNDGKIAEFWMQADMMGGIAQLKS